MEYKLECNIHNNGYRSYREFINQVQEICLTKQSFACLSYSDLAVKRRIKQAIYEYEGGKFLKDYFQELSGDNKKKECGISLNNKEIRVTLKLRIISYFYFIVFWIKVLAHFLISLLKYKNQSTRNISLLCLYGHENTILKNNGNDFFEFCKKGFVQPLVDSDLIIVECRRASAHLKKVNVVLVRNVIDEYFSTQKYSLKRATVFLYHHVKAFLVYTEHVIRNPLFVLLWRDLSYHALWVDSSRHKAISNIFISNSHVSSQELPLIDLEDRYHQLHLLPYSAGFWGVTLKSEKSSITHPGNWEIKVDKVWCWFKEQADWFLSNEYAREIITCHPVLYYLPPFVKVALPIKNKITCFDITPFKNYDSFLGCHYYALENMLQFIKDIIEVKADSFKSFNLEIKPKRDYLEIHFKEYIAQLEKFADLGEIILVNSASNMFELIDGSSVVIAIPFTSPAYIAALRGVPAIFYDPSMQLICTHPLINNLYWASGKKELELLLKKILS